MEQYSNLNVHGKIKQLQNQADITDENNQHDVVLVGTLNAQVPSALPTPAAANEGKAIISNGSGYEFGEAGKVDAVQINGTAIAGDGAQTKIANIIPGSGLTSNGATINHSNSVSGGAETTGKGSSTAIPIIKYDAQGHITSVTTATVYPPTTAGTSGQVWKSDGSGQGAWTALKTINSESLVGSGNIKLVPHNDTTASQVYATDGSKNDSPISYSTGATQGHIVQRGTGGQITVPSTPSADTDAASKAFVNSSVGTNTATFRGTYNAVSDLGNTQATVDAWSDPPTSTVETLVAGQIATKLASLSVTPENNDYVFVSVDQTPVGDLGEDWYWRFKYSDPSNNHTGSWGYEYTLNNSSFTQAQWDAVNSGITATKVGTYDTHVSTAKIHVPTATVTGLLLTSANNNTPSWSTTCYVSSNKLYSNSIEVVNLSDTQVLTNKTVNGLTLTAETTGFSIQGGTTSKKLIVNANYTLAAACAKAVTDSSSASAIGTGTSLPTERDIYYGLPFVNDVHNYTSSTTYYAPTTAGTDTYVLHSTGSGAPSWAAPSTIFTDIGFASTDISITEVN